MKNLLRYFLCGILLAGTAFKSQAQVAESKFPDYILTDPSGALDFKKQPFDVLNYEVNLDLTDAPAKTARGICTVTVRWLMPPAGEFFTFHLRGMKVDSVFNYYGTKLPVTAVGDSNSADFHYKIPASEISESTEEFAIFYSGTMTGEYPSSAWGGVQNDGGCLYALGVGFSNEYVSATRHWMPCYDHPSDKATCVFNIRVKSGKTAVSNGYLFKDVKNADSTHILQWRSSDKMATYLMTFAVDNYVALNFKPEITTRQSLPIVVYSKPQDSALTRKSFKNLPRMVSSYEKLYGQYPFEKVGYCNTPKGAMEHQTMISYPTSLSRSGDEVNSVAAHELAHQWWGDLVTPLDFRHAWLTESFATFSESVWAEELGGRAGFLKDQTDKLNRYIKTVSKAEGIFPLYDFPRASPSSNYPETIYQKGAVVLGMLRYELGDSLYFGALKSYLTKYAYGNATTDSLFKTVNDYTGRDMAWFFNQWVLGKGWPQLAVESARLAEGFKRVRLVLKQRQPADQGVYTNLPVEIGFKTSSGETVYKLLKMTEKEQTFELDSIPDFTGITMNEGPSVRALVQFFSLTDVENNSVVRTEKHFEIQPNPATESATLVFSATENSTLEVFTLFGQKVFSQNIPAAEGATRFVLKTDNFPAGIYFVKIGGAQNSLTEQLSIVR
ncbi:MAG: M1 family aminopeptidase [Bacteroidota bacterium]